ncbi:MAG TPA: glycosyltransferase family 2 protein [Gemmataceae bacterium]|nr:glycosyltransferase family 2 protein [Gemmataceae bacterium]
MAAPPCRDEIAAIDVSVCIANWNCRNLLRGCLGSLTDELQEVRLETIVVDNASTDGAADMVAREFPHVTLIRNTNNTGFSKANNQAVAKARGQYLFFLNNDTLVPPGTLRHLVDFLEAHPEAGMVGPRLRDGEGNIQVSYRPRPTVATLLHRTSLFRWTGLFRSAYQAYRRREFDPATTAAVDVLMGAAVLVNRKRFLAWGGWDEDFTFGGEDMELSYRVNQQAAVVFYPGAEVVHYGRSSTRQNFHFASLNIAIGLVQYLRKTGSSRPGVWAFKLAVTLDAPLQVLVKGSQFLIRRMLGRRKSARKSLLAAQAPGHFLARGLVRFWKA